MQIHRVRGRDLREALERASRSFGAQALVLSHEVMPDGGVTVAVGDPRRSAASRAASAPEPRDRGLEDVERVLRRNGGSEELVRSTLGEVRASGALGAFALDAAAAALGRRIAVAPSPRVARRASGALARPCTIAFVGPTGVGKTTTLAKLASRLVRAGRRVGVVSMDKQRPGAVEQLAALGRAMQAPVDVASDGADLARIVARSHGVDCCLVDTTGRSPRDLPALEELSRSLAQAQAPLETYLVVPATASRAALAQAREGFAALRPGAWVVTKLDETHEPAAVLESAAEAGASLAFLCDGQEIARHLHRADPERIADLFLRGRLA
jgi:flagellar biosynthesis protein FlhF